ncbi:helix-turn-helix transcriptional regulator [Caballeronia sp. AZ1_KS37]|uniref:helix-turn-helix domain-containing protein n=1 Tax=Caballeronia sp. AZ1_KS37 TaxID=2921756 RepID=UPI002027E4A3|nr:helix-turn-helix transcriptional regulator [Caballeronia sp. AZ1_KS37]
MRSNAPCPHRLGARIASARKAHELTQQQLAAQLGIAQQTLAHYEGGRLRLPVSLLPELTRTLGLSADEILGQNATPRGSKRGPSSKLQQQIETIGQLPKARQRFVSDA